MSQQFDAFVETIRRLRAPDGCPWDRKQTHESIAHNIIEEGYEAVDAIEAADIVHLREELGDVLLQVVLQSQIAADNGEFTIDDVIAEVKDKIIRRHPHVFGETAVADDAEQVLAIWDRVKLAEKVAEDKEAPVKSLLDSTPRSMPALMQAQKISRKAVSVGFEWEDEDAVWAQVEEEIAEFKAAEPGTEEEMLEFGDVLFSLVNVARKRGIDSETALRSTCEKFRSRWTLMERAAYAEGRAIGDYSTEELNVLWNRAKEELERA